MPFHFGEAPELFKHLALEETTGMNITYLTDKDALSAFLPEPYEPADEPLASIYYLMIKRCEFVAWRPYNCLGVCVSAVFNGKKDHVPGMYILVEWESVPFAAILGREFLGDPKIYADVSDVERRGDTWHANVSEYGTRLLECEVRNAKEVGEVERKKIEKEHNDSLLVCWKYIPRADGKGPELSIPVTLPWYQNMRRVWVGEGSHKYLEATWEQAPVSFRATKGLKTLVVKEYREAIVTEGRGDLPITESRALE